MVTLSLIVTVLAMLALMVATNAVPTPAPKPSIDPCALISNENVFRLLGWSVTSKKRTYRKFYSAAGYAFHRRAGWLCFLESSAGVITVTVAAPNATFPGDSPFDELRNMAYSKELHGYPASVLLFSGTAYIRRHHRDVSVKVSPYDHVASYNEVESFVPIVISRLP